MGFNRHVLVSDVKYRVVMVIGLLVEALVVLVHSWGITVGLRAGNVRRAFIEVLIEQTLELRGETTLVAKVKEVPKEFGFLIRLTQALFSTDQWVSKSVLLLGGESCALWLQRYRLSCHK